MKISVIGAGLAGCEAAYKIAQAGYMVDLYEMKPYEMSPAHHCTDFAELVCSNSLKAYRINSAAGLLKWEMKQLDSLCIKVAETCQIPAGGAMAVDRNIFSGEITKIIKNHKNIRVVSKRVDTIPKEGIVIIATGPLTDGQLYEEIKNLCGRECLNFYDAAAPIITFDSIDMTKAFYGSRYADTDTEGDYINCPMNKEEYEKFHEALINAEGVIVHEFDKPVTVYEGCMPVEILAKRGKDSIRFGPLKPVGLRDPNTNHRPWAVVQLRKENNKASLFNIVGFQTNLKFKEQDRIIRMIPGLENAEVVRYGVMHRNSFINSPKLLNNDFSMRNNEKIYFAGQISGVEGYMESASSGIIAGMSVVNRIQGKSCQQFPDITMLGALTCYISDESVSQFQPMGANFGILPSIEEKIKNKQERYLKISNRSVDWFKENIK